MVFDFEKMYCGAIRRGDVFLCLHDKKELLVVVLQDHILNERLSTVVVAQILPHQAGDKIFKNEVFLKGTETGLGENGIGALHKIFTVDRRQMIAKKGELTKEKLQEVFEAMDINCGRFRDR